MGKIKKYFVESRCASRNCARAKRKWKKKERRKIRYSVPLELTDNSLQEKLTVFLELNSELNWDELLFFKAVAWGKELRDSKKISRAHAGCSPHFYPLVRALRKSNGWKTPVALWLLDISQEAFEYEMRYVLNFKTD